MGDDNREHSTARDHPDAEDLAAADRDAGFEVLESFERFRQRNEVFNRAQWDPLVRSEDSVRFFAGYGGPLGAWKAADGYTQKDYALRNASWHIKDLFGDFKQSQDRNEGSTDEFSALSESASERVAVPSPSAMSAEIKKAAKALGADLVGIADYDERWVYTHNYTRQSGEERPIVLSEELTHVIVIAIEMDHDLIQTVPSALSGVATGMGYSLETAALLSIAQFIRHLGYQAVACLNDTALSVPLAVQAGLGEYGRNGLLITKEFGPRHRLGKIFTDLPLVSDRPLRFGVREFCEICQRCAGACPSKAIPNGAPSAEPVSLSTIRGVRKWSIDGERCFQFWASQNSDCSICIRVCPYNKDYSKWLHRAARWLAGTRLRKLLLRADDWMGYGKREQPKSWWRQAA